MVVLSIARRVVVTATVVFLLAIPSTVRAQAPGTRLPVANKQVVSANPFLLMARWANVEYERKASENFTFGGSVSGVSLSGASYRNLEGFYRYYPQGASLTGFYLGARGGTLRVSADGDAAQVFGLGFELGYGWLFGSERNFAVSLGAGATRIFGGDLDGHSLYVPTLRLVNIGWSF
jgi:hypothetical protein